MSIKQELISFTRQIDAITAGYKSWGFVYILRVAIRDGENIYATPPMEDIFALTEADLKLLDLKQEADQLVKAIFENRKKINCIIFTRQEYASMLREEVPPILDDQAQLLGVSIRIANPGEGKNGISNVIFALKNRYAAVRHNGVCISIGGTVDDAYIAAQLLEKTSKAFTEAKYLGGAKSINRFEAWAMQMYFQFKYAKEAKKNK